jgi:hypothetical protein
VYTALPGLPRARNIGETRADARHQHEIIDSQSIFEDAAFERSCQL